MKRVSHRRVTSHAVVPSFGFASVVVLAAFAQPSTVLAPNAVVSQPTTNVAGPDKPRLVILGVDGMDPEILAGVIERHPERTQNLAWLAEQGGGIHSLGTSNPPQSPVAWSNFITGRDPGGHGIFDFIHRDPVTRMPAGSTTRTKAGFLSGLLGTQESNRSGEPFWQLLADAGVPADIWRMPINFPVEETDGVSFPGMMTPAVDSAYGEATLFSTDPFVAERISSDKVKAGLTEVLGQIDTEIDGPDSGKRDAQGHAIHHAAPLTIYIDRDAGENGAAVIDTGLEQIIMEPGEWSDFVTFSFKTGMLSTQSGVARFYLRSIEPNFEMYASPVNIDPFAPVAPVSEPSSASADLAEAIGTYYTQGMAEDVNAFKKHMLDPAEFFEQSTLVYEERRRMLDYALDRYLDNERGGLLFFYFSTVDLMGHMLWRFSDPEHPDFAAEYAELDSSELTGRAGSRWIEILDDIYLRVDPVVAKLRERMDASGEPWDLVLMSDHGFAPFYRKVSLNTWLYENGYLVLADGKTPELTDGKVKIEDQTMLGMPGAVDWSKTRAYGVGFNGLYLNRVGRELDNPKTQDVDESGIVKPEDADALIAEIAAALEGWTDPETGQKIVLSADPASVAYAGTERLAEAPDILVGYNLGYENSEASTLGRVPKSLVQPNMGNAFNGSHLVHPSLVEGILLSTIPPVDGEHALEDLTVEVLGHYGVDPVDGMHGHRVFAASHP